jgi:hypothetical protein
MFTRARRLVSASSLFVMNSHSAARTSGSPSVPSFSLAQRLSALAEAAQDSDYIFGSPLGPFFENETAHYLPRFVYFGPDSSPASLRLALVAGTGRHDLLSAQALVAFIEGLIQRPDLGHGLNLSFFPVVNVQRFLGGAEEHDLSAAHWGNTSDPEIRLLTQEVRVRGYHGFIVVETTTDEAPTARVRTVLTENIAASDVELFNSEDFLPWSVRFESITPRIASRGPLTLAMDLAFAPFEVEILLPAQWSQTHTDRRLAALLKRLLQRYRGFHAYGQHL